VHDLSPSGRILEIQADGIARPNYVRAVRLFRATRIWPVQFPDTSTGLNPFTLGESPRKSSALRTQRRFFAQHYYRRAAATWRDRTPVRLDTVYSSNGKQLVEANGNQHIAPKRPSQQ